MIKREIISNNSDKQCPCFGIGTGLFNWGLLETLWLPVDTLPSGGAGPVDRLSQSDVPVSWHMFVPISCCFSWQLSKSKGEIHAGVGLCKILQEATIVFDFLLLCLSMMLAAWCSLFLDENLNPIHQINISLPPPNPLYLHRTHSLEISSETTLHLILKQIFGVGWSRILPSFNRNLLTIDHAQYWHLGAQRWKDQGHLNPLGTQGPVPGLHNIFRDLWKCFNSFKIRTKKLNF